MSICRRRAAGLVALCLAACAPAFAQSPRAYAVLSLVGDKLTMVSPRMTTGSHTDRNLRMEIATPDDGLDVIAVTAAGEALQRHQPGVPPSLFTSRDPKLFALQEALLESEELSAELAQSLKALLAEAKASHFVLITKYRAETSMRLYSTAVGRGKLAGLGFYVDRHMELKDVETGAKMTGFFSPYAYLRFALIDAATLQPVRRWTARATNTVGSRPGSIDNAWNQYDPTQKTQLLNDLLRDTVGDGVARLLLDPPAR
jgi:hypothetical protein